MFALARVIVFSLAVVSAAELAAQPVIGPAVPLTSVATGIGGLSSSAQSLVGTGGTLAPVGPAGGSSPWQWRGIEVRPHVAYQFTYGDGIQSQPGNPVKTSIHTITLGLNCKLGESVTVDYSAIETLYSQRDLTDSLSHNINLGTGKGKQVGVWLLGISQSFGASLTPLVETARQTKTEVSTTGLSASRALGRKFALELSVSQTARFAGSLGNTWEWSTTDSLNYALTKRLGVGLFVGAGYSDISNAPNSTFQKYGARANWKLSDKLDVALDFGINSRTAKGTSASSASAPTYSFLLNYRPFEFTNISVMGMRSSSISLYQNQVQDSESWRLGISQRLLGKLMFNMGVDHSSSGFQAAVVSSATSRADARKGFNVGLSAKVLKRGSVSVSYQRSTNGSNTSGFGFSSSQISAQLGYNF
jgi:hypothetical protein